MNNTPAAPGGLTPIETEYKGYLFRSRLEARWAYYFDLCGIRWQYEVEGFMLSDGQRYLPDFWLPDFNQFVEVKPDSGEDYVNRIGRPSVYMAGKMGEPKDNKLPGECWRPLNIDLNFNMRTYMPDWPYDVDPAYLSDSMRMSLLGVEIDYVGPWKGRGYDHGWQHGVTTCGWPEANKYIYNKSLAGIEDCNEFFALLTDKTAYGTLFETGRASALGKNIVVGIRPVEENAFAADHNWFAAQSASLVIEGATDVEIVSKYADYLRKKYPETKYDVMMRDAAREGVGFRIVIGDPRTMKVNTNLICRELPYNNAAAEAARQYRFGR